VNRTKTHSFYRFRVTSCDDFIKTSSKILKKLIFGRLKYPTALGMNRVTMESESKLWNVFIAIPFETKGLHSSS